MRLYSVTAASSAAPIGTSVDITFYVEGWNGAAVHDWPVSISVEGGTLLDIVNGVVENSTSGYGMTGQDGEITISVTRQDVGPVTVTAMIDEPRQQGHAFRSVQVYFSALVNRRQQMLYS